MTSLNQSKKYLLVDRVRWHIHLLLLLSICACCAEFYFYSSFGTSGPILVGLGILFIPLSVYRWYISDDINLDPPVRDYGGGSIDFDAGPDADDPKDSENWLGDIDD